MNAQWCQEDNKFNVGSDLYPHVNPTSTCRADFAFLGVQSSQKCGRGHRLTAVQNLTQLHLSSAEKSVTVETCKKTNKETVKDKSTPCLSACVNNKAKHLILTLICVLCRWHTTEQSPTSADRPPARHTRQSHYGSSQHNSCIAPSRGTSRRVWRTIDHHRVVIDVLRHCPQLWDSTRGRIRVWRMYFYSYFPHD